VIRNFPFRYHDLVKDLVVDEKPYTAELIRMVDARDLENRPQADGKSTVGAVNATLGGLSQAKLFFAPHDLGSRIWNAAPGFVSSDMVRVSFDSIFIEFGIPVDGLGFGDDAKAKVYGIHVAQVYGGVVRQSIHEEAVDADDRYITMVKWGKLKANPNEWAASLFAFSCKQIGQVTKELVVIDGKKYNVPNRVSAHYLRHLAFVMFLNSSNISYELRQAPKQPRPKDRSWWRKGYESKFEELVVKDVSRRIALSLRRNESGAGWDHSAFVRGHFKVLSYCGVCGMKRAVLRFLRNEICHCGSPLNPETAKTRTFWWEGHWAGPDIVDKVIAEGA